MTLTLGANHSTSVPAIFTIAKPQGLSIALTNIPNYVPATAGTPLEYHGLGRINLGNAFGYMKEISLRLVHELVLALPDELTLMSVNPLSGITVSVDEIVRPAVLNSALMPWDRNPAPWSQVMQAQLGGGTANTTAWTYTVPAGKKLLVAKASVWLQRWSPNTAQGVPLCYMTLNGAVFLEATLVNNVVGGSNRDDLSGSGLVLAAGQIIAGVYGNGDVAGQVSVAVTAGGFLFDA